MDIKELIPLIYSKDIRDRQLAANIFENNFMGNELYIPHLLYFAEYTFYINDNHNVNNCFSNLFEKLPCNGIIVRDLYVGGDIWYGEWNTVTNTPESIDWFPNGDFNNSLLEHIKSIIREWKI